LPRGGWPAVAEWLGPRLARAALIAAGVLLVATAVPAWMSLRDDPQRVQRAALAFVDRNFDPAARGFQAEGALLCRADPNPFGTYFGDTVQSRMTGPGAQPRIDAFIAEFRERPVSFLIAHRLFPFPDPIDTFWRTHYVYYRDEVLVPGRRIGGPAGTTAAIEIIVPGRYRWRPVAPSADARLRLGPEVIEPGASIVLERGTYEFTLVDEVASGLLTLEMRDDPQPPGRPFYDVEMIRELDPIGPRFEMTF
jgi:hypothetical protein